MPLLRGSDGRRGNSSLTGGKMHVPLEVKEVRGLSPRVKLFVLDGELRSRPGQYLMVWVPGVGEVPISVATEAEGETWLLIARVGEVTSAIHSLGQGDRLWVRGPYGRGFTVSPGRHELVAGGYGVAPLIYLGRELVNLGAEVRFYAGFRTREEVLLEGVMRDLGETVITTDDGSYGLKGYVIEHLDLEWPDYAHLSGPEPMIEGALNLFPSRVRVEASMERLIRCSVGLCGSCVLEPLGLRVCVDGPVFPREVLRKVKLGLWLGFDGRLRRGGIRGSIVPPTP